ncbi:MAG: LytTR family transcriptional regulator [Bacteroidales bacterium]|nr:LytTR family transcriptional regulator [Bacteroidales bacterium]MBN2757023.1 LytTR family transcriptional regulator [Bacteroidales bacterium]
MQKNIKIIIPNTRENKITNVKDIVLIKSKDKCTEIFDNKNIKILECKSLKILEEELNTNCFFRYHKSFIINQNYIDSIDLEYKK